MSYERASDRVGRALVLALPAYMLTLMSARALRPDVDEPNTAAIAAEKAAILSRAAFADAGFPEERPSYVPKEETKLLTRINNVTQRAFIEALCDNDEKKPFSSVWRGMEFWLQDLLDAGRISIDPDSEAGETLMWLARFISGEQVLEFEKGAEAEAATAERFAFYQKVSRSGRKAADRLHEWLLREGYGLVAMSPAERNFSKDE